MSRNYRPDTFAGKGYDAQAAETISLLERGATFTVAELARVLDISPSRCGDILNDLVARGHATAAGRPRRFTTTAAPEVDPLDELLAELDRTAVEIHEATALLEQLHRSRETTILSCLEAGAPQRLVAERAKVSPGRVGQIATKART